MDAVFTSMSPVVLNGVLDKAGEQAQKQTQQAIDSGVGGEQAQKALEDAQKQLEQAQGEANKQLDQAQQAAGGN